MNIPTWQVIVFGWLVFSTGAAFGVCAISLFKINEPENVEEEEDECGV